MSFSMFDAKKIEIVFGDAAIVMAPGAFGGNLSLGNIFITLESALSSGAPLEPSEIVLTK